MSKFYKYFKENMEALGLVPPPQSLFGTQQLAIGTMSTLLGCIGAHHYQSNAAIHDASVPGRKYYRTYRFVR